MPTDNSGSIKSASDAAASVGNLPNNTAGQSTEQLYSPIIIQANGTQPNGVVASFDIPQDDFLSFGVFDQFSLAPTRTELDPYFSNILGDASTFITNTDFQMMVNNGSGSNGADLNIRKVDRTSISQVRVSHHRGPMILSGWGFDHGDRPFPYAGSDPYTFDSACVGDRSTHAAGPIDFRWDRLRKVWTMGHHTVCGVAEQAITAPTSPCSPTYFSMKVFRNEGASVTSGDLSNCDLDEALVVTNRDPSLSQEDVPGLVFVIATRVNYEYIPVWVGCPDPNDEADTACIC